MIIRFAEPDDFGWLADNDRHIEGRVLRAKIAHSEIMVALDTEYLGWLRFGLFWDNTPFMNLLFVVERYRAIGIGRALVEFWEKAMLEHHHRVLLTSTLSSETSQHFYRKLGYTDIGGFTLPGEPLELLLMKTLNL